MDKKILVIEDNPQDRKLVTVFLNKAGYKNIVFAQTGQEGIKAAGAEMPDLIVLDTVLPDKDGFQICTEIKEMLGQDCPKIVITTGSVFAVDALKAKRAGADDYCAKTSDFSSLIEAVKNLI